MLVAEGLVSLITFTFMLGGKNNYGVNILFEGNLFFLVEAS